LVVSITHHDSASFAASQLPPLSNTSQSSPAGCSTAIVRACCGRSNGVFVPKAPLSWRALSPGLVIAASILACGEGGGGGSIQEPKPVKTVTVTAPTTNIQIGQTVQLPATAKDEDGAVVEGSTFIWHSLDEAVAGVFDGSGIGSRRGPSRDQRDRRGHPGQRLHHRHSCCSAASRRSGLLSGYRRSSAASASLPGWSRHRATTGCSFWRKPASSG
jgi:hypothetical protein